MVGKLHEAGMTELEAVKWIQKCPGLELRVCVGGLVVLKIEGRVFKGHFIESVRKAIAEGF